MSLTIQKYNFNVLAVLFTALLVSGCAEHMKQTKPGDGSHHPTIEENYTVSFNKKGDIVVKDSKGRPLKKDKERARFPIKATRIHSITNYTVVHFEGSDCLSLSSNGKTEVYCFTH